MGIRTESQIGNAGGSPPVEARTGGHRHGARKARPHNCVEVIVKRLQNRPRYPGNASAAATIGLLELTESLVRLNSHSPLSLALRRRR